MKASSRTDVAVEVELERPALSKLRPPSKEPRAPRADAVELLVGQLQAQALAACRRVVRRMLDELLRGPPLARRALRVRQVSTA